MEAASIPPTAFRYRPDIDGLRAIAVLSVVAFHIGAGHAPGGFVGVDVFFVISGYLISAILFSEIDGFQFSVLRFYERRIRRIFPALFAMLIIYSAVVGFLLLPSEFVDFAKSLLAAATSTSNFYFWKHSGYFNSPESSPLLHTWSLAVEEQFYILFPIFLVAIRRFFPRRLLLAVAILFFASLAASIVMVFFYPVAAFYMPYTRAWELLLGTLVSQHVFPPLTARLPRNLATMSGMALISYAVLKYNAETTFPGAAALMPCLGTALIIGAGEFGPTLAGKVLSWPPIVFVGLISYSVYLWHWPVIILHTMGLSFNLESVLPHRLAALVPMFRFDMWMEIILTFVLAALSWRFIERPFRSRPLKIGRRPLFATSAAVLVVLISFSTTVILARGFQGRFSPRAAKIASFIEKKGVHLSDRLGGCFIDHFKGSDISDNAQCLQLVRNKPNYLLLGDSHAAALWSGLNASLPDMHLLLVSGSNCKPLVNPYGSPGCVKEMRYLFQSFLSSHPLQGIFLEARWKNGDMEGLKETVDWAKAHNLPVIVFGPVAEYDAPLPRLLTYSITWKKPDLASQHRLLYSSAMDARMQELAANTWHVRYVSLYQAICSRDTCTEFADAAREVPLMNDSDHLSELGSLLIAKRLIERGQLSY